VTVIVREASSADVDGLVDVLLSVVAADASVGFMSTLSREEASSFWASHLASPSNVVLVLEDDGDVLGTATLALSGMPNGRHRAEVAKVLVRTDAQGRGLGRVLLRSVEAAASLRGRRTLVLDTVSGSPAQRLYESEGWQVVGEIPDYADLPDGTPSPTTYLYKRLA
jgi:GNAT superfamily N-acetyltransferase